jgi:uncharacterized NAD(P)/FAD-binding protein YdhS
MVDLRDTSQLERWAARTGLLKADPEARTADGGLYLRRRDFARFLAEAVRAEPSIRHVRAQATAAEWKEGGYLVTTSSGATVACDGLIAATGNAPTRPPREFGGVGVIDWTDLERVRAIPGDARVLVLGMGLTALDIISTLVRRGHAGGIVAISRRGLRPRQQRPRRAPEPGSPTLLERIEGPVSPFLAQLGATPRLRQLVRAVRTRVRELEAAGETWHAGFDDLRDVLWQVWPRMRVAEKKRFLRHFRAWYDAHRFRSPPQNEAIVRDAEARGLVVFRAARVGSARQRNGGGCRVEWVHRGAQGVEMFDAVVNCTGADLATMLENPFLASLVASGQARPDPCGIGLAVDLESRALRPDGGASESLRVIGPPAAGSLGDPLGTLFIAAHVRRMIPGFVKALLETANA